MPVKTLRAAVVEGSSRQLPLFLNPATDDWRLAVTMSTFFLGVFHRPSLTVTASSFPSFFSFSAYRMSETISSPIGTLSEGHDGRECRVRVLTKSGFAGNSLTVSRRMTMMDVV